MLLEHECVRDDCQLGGHVRAGEAEGPEKLSPLDDVPLLLGLYVPGLLHHLLLPTHHEHLLQVRIKYTKQFDFEI